MPKSDGPRRVGTACPQALEKAGAPEQGLRKRAGRRIMGSRCLSHDSTGGDLVRASAQEAKVTMEPEISTASRVILFWDLHSYSIAARRLGARHASFLQESYERMGEIVVSHGGTIVKYLGDAMLCVFPERAETRAVACALEMRPAFAALARQWGLPPDTELEVGIASGEVAMGVFGHQSLRMWDVFGETVNVAATIGHHEGIAVTEGVREAVSKAYETRRLPDLKVKWQDEPLRLWEVEEAQG